MSFEAIEILSSGAGQVNEDCASGAARFLYVIDGASGLNEQEVSPSGTDAAWFSSRLGQLLDEALAEGSLSTPDILRKAMVHMRSEFEGFLGGRSVDERTWPSAGLSIVRMSGSEIELYQLGDCVALWRTTQGTVELSQDLTLPDRDRAVVARQVAAATRLGTSVREARAQVDDELRHNRAQRNRADGYWILDLSGTGISHAQMTTLPAADVQAVALMSDGFWTAVADLGLYRDASALLVDFDLRSGQEILADIRAAESDDPDLNRHPRLKPSDDASVVYARIQ